MHWLQALDSALFRVVNQALSNPLFDALMPFASGNRFFVPAVLLAGIALLWKGGARGRLCVLMLALIVGPGDGLICNTIKHAVARPRPYVTQPDVRLPARRPAGGEAQARPQAGNAKPTPGAGAFKSMPSSHAANWFAATMIFFVYFRRSWRVLLPLACLVSFSRVYNGVHYPSDVLAGAILGAGYAVAGLWLLNGLWIRAGRRWFPLWHEKLPSLVTPGTGKLTSEDAIVDPDPERASRLDRHWLRLGYLFIVALLLVNLGYLASGLAELSGDEAYQWVWSKHPALSYYSKPPMIAYVQFVGTHLWGDTEFGVRFFSPVIGSILGFLVLRFFAREVNARAGFCLLVAMAATPLLAAGSILMTVDPLSVLFWTAAMMAGWRAARPDGKTASWLWTGLWMGLGFLSKYTQLFQWLCWLVFFILWKPARVHLRRPGPYLALLLNLLATVPVLIWNQQHNWITVAHVADNAGADRAGWLTPGHFLEFMGTEAALLNPVFFVAALWAAVAFWRRYRHDPRMVYLFSMGAPLFLCYVLQSFRARILPNWIAPSVLPLFCLMAIYWDHRWRLGVRAVKGWLIAGLSLGLTVVVVAHETDLVKAVAGRTLPPTADPLVRARGYRDAARVAGEARTKLQSEGKPVFIIGAHYQITGLLSFYLPEARTNVVNDPVVYYLTSDQPRNQFYFWPGYRERCRGQNAIFVRRVGGPPLVRRWYFKWLAGETNLLRSEPRPGPIPPVLLEEFDSVTDLGLHPVLYRGRVLHTLQILECRNLR